MLSYVNGILQPVVPVWVQQGTFFHDDNARPHRGLNINDFIGQQDIQRLEWTAKSPDLNPIEHNWDELGRKVYRLNPSTSDARAGQHSAAYNQEMRAEREKAMPSLYKCPRRTCRVLKLRLVIKFNFLDLGPISDVIINGASYTRLPKNTF